MTTPTTAYGEPRLRTASSIVGESSLARPTTATSAATSRPRLTHASRASGGSACPSPSSSSTPITRPCSSLATGRKKSRWRMVWVKTNAAYSAREATAANPSWEGENSRPAADVVKLGNTMLTPASVMTVATAEPVLEALKLTRWCLSPPTSRQMPTMPLRVIISAAKTVSRA